MHDHKPRREFSPNQRRSITMQKESITLEGEDYKALIDVMQYVLENERKHYEECEGDIDALRNHIWWKARILLHAVNT